MVLEGWFNVVLVHIFMVMTSSPWARRSTRRGEAARKGEESRKGRERERETVSLSITRSVEERVLRERGKC